ncbi:hypothetical protein C0Q70_17937 [Pomacea canaliculata]|uniref:Deleted in malignant brain tumors 1 protein-like n=1 Tax=Pomacea canaliculata TaxID=400727 RepID=A0A2T7NLT8_POMCA|nr:hypothetical protein C0Q70_17937 [Pomacea canaliculata]
MAWFVLAQAHVPFPSQYGEIFLYGQDASYKGTVLISYNNTWGSVCDDGWGLEEATVVCRQLGFTGSRIIPRTNSYYGPGTGAVLMDDVYCIGTEGNLTQCTHTPWGVSNCDHNEDAGVDCDPSVDAQASPVKLVGGSNEREGQVRVWKNGVWGSVCDDGWDFHAAQVLCNQLNFTGTIGVPTTAGYFSNGTTDPNLLIMLNNIRCTGNESSIDVCFHRPWMANSCRLDQNAGVICVTPPQGGVNLQVRLAGGINKYQGRVEIQVFRHWGTICSHRFGPEDAQVVCRMLGYGGGTNLNQLYQGGGGPIWLDDLGCTGSEVSLLNCSRKPWGVSDCTHANDASVSCTAPGGGDHIISMIEGGGSKGRLIVSVNGQQGVICDHNATNAIAMVVCNELGLNTSNAIITTGQSAIASPTVLDNVVCVGTERTLSGCRYSKTNFICPANQQVWVDCQADYNGLTISLKTRTGQPPWQGTVLVQYNNTWGTICDDHFDVTDARVVCNQLGFNSSTPLAVGSAVFGAGDGPVWITDLACTGTEANIANCRHSAYGVTKCRHYEDAGVVCTPGNINDITSIRLVGPTPYEGRVEVYYNGTGWGTVCDDHFNDRAAAVVCRMMGFNTTVAKVRDTHYYGSGGSTMSILLDEVNCQGDETNIFQCGFAPIGTSDCGHSEDVGVLCQGPTTSVTPSSGNMTARLVGGNATEGRLEVNFNNQWGTVCDDYFSDVDAQVVCAMLGITGGLPRMLPIGTYPPGTGIIWMDDVDCVGNETNLDACKHRQLGTNNCDHSEDVAVACGPLIPTITQIRLAGGDDHQGRVEIQHNGFWGTLCDDSWGIKEARVTCNQLGLTNSKRTANDISVVFNFVTHQCRSCANGKRLLRPRKWSDLAGRAPTSPAPFVVRLSGGASMYEGRVEVRYNNYWGTVCDDNFEPVDAQIVCRTLGYSGGKILTHVGAGRAGEMDLPVRLSNGGGPDSGRVEVQYDGRWGTVCDTNFDNNVAAVICRQLGYSTATAQAFGGSHFGAAPDEYIAWVSGIQCVGAEPWIGQCNISMNTGACDNTHTAGVACNGGPLPAINVRLVGGGNGQEGRVEISYNGTWGTVCDDYWDHDDAVVICRMLGLPTNNVIPRGGGYFISGTRPTKIWLDDLKCLGSETSIAQCPHAGWGQSNCLHSEDAGVVCGGSVPMSPIRLVGGLTTHEGRVEIFYNNTWGTVCDDFFGTEEATVVCRSLGFQTQGAVAFPRARYGAGTGTIWLDDVSCAGSEQYLDMCAYRPWGHSNCAHREDVSVSCGGVPTSAAIRLVGSHNNFAGRVEMMVNGTWGTVCSDLWSTMDAIVVCGMLGFPRTGSQAVVSSQFGHGSGPIWLDDVQCTGYEESLLNCRAKPLGQTNCDHTQDAGVICSGNPLQIRLTPGPSQGFLEVEINDTWGSVCDSGLEGAPGQAVARVVCRQLDQPFSGAYSVTHGRLGQGSGPVMLDALSCTGQENFLGQCRHSPAGAVLCQPSQTLGIVCAAATTTTVTTPPSTTPAPVIDYITLGGNFTAYSGRVDVYHNGMWGTVCNHNWTNQDASVVCKMLGYSGQNATALVNPQVYGAGTGIIWLDNVKCDGTETNIGACHSWNWGTTNCVHSQDVGVACAPGELPDTFLLFTDWNKTSVFRMDMMSYSYITVPLQGMGRPFAIDYDYINSRIYWTDLDARLIRSARVDGTQSETVLALGATADAEGLAVDPLSGLLFYTDTGYDIIALVTFAGHQRKVIINTDLQEPRPIVLDVMNGIMFWADWGSNPKIERANYDGTSRQAIVTSDLTWPNALALDIPNQRIFWVDTSNTYDDKVEYSDLFGDNRMAIYSEPRTHFMGMALYDRHIYLSDWQSRSLKHMQTDGTNVMNVGTPTFGYINDVVVHVDGADPQGPNGCTQNRNCSRICIPRPGNSFTCMCPDGLFLQTDGSTCGRTTTCPPMQAPFHGIITCTSPSLVKTVCTLGCDPGFVLTTTTTITCLSTGYWDYQYSPNACLDVQPPVIQCPGDVIANAAQGNTSAVISWPPPTATDNSGSVNIVVSMTPPIVLSEGVYNITAAAFDAAGLSATCTFSATVTVGRCQPYTVPQNAQLVSLSCPTHYGATCQIACLPGYQMANGSPITTVFCGTSYTWVPSPPSCNPVTCPPLKAPAYGSISPNTCLTSSSPSGSSCSFSCQNGFRLTSGSPNVTCTSSGQWGGSGRMPVCEDVQPPTITCPGNVTVTAASATTTAQATWAAPTVQDNAGKDQVVVTSSVTSGVTLSEGQHSVVVRATDRAGFTASCSFFVVVSVLRCPKMQLPANAVLLTPNCQNLLGSTCTVTCRTGYSLSGSSVITCSLNGAQAVWGTLPVSVTCQKPPPPLNGVVAGCSGVLTVGSTCTQACNSGYVLVSGNAVRSCLSDGTWSGAVATCKPWDQHWLDLRQCPCHQCHRYHQGHQRSQHIASPTERLTD